MAIYNPFYLAIRKFSNDFLDNQVLNMMANGVIKPTNVEAKDVSSVANTKVNTARPINTVLNNATRLILKSIPKVHVTENTSTVENVNEPVDFINAYINDLKIQENSIKKGYDSNSNRWTAIPSPEGGAKTIGYGIKLNPGTKWANLYNAQGYLTNEQVESSLRESAINARNKAVTDFNSMTGGDFYKLAPAAQQALTDHVYNIGNLYSFPKYVNGLYNNDLDTVMKNYVRHYKDPITGEKRPLTARNKYTKDLLDSMNNNGVFLSYIK